MHQQHQRTICPLKTSLSNNILIKHHTFNSFFLAEMLEACIIGNQSDPTSLTGSIGVMTLL